MTSIPTYSADNIRLRNYPLAAIERLQARGEVRVERNRRNQIVRATWTARKEQPSPMRSRQTLPAGVTVYSWEEHVAEQFYVWRHRDLIDTQELAEESIQSKAEADAFLRAVFLAVPLSCSQAATHTPAIRAAMTCSFGAEKQSAMRRARRRSKR